MTFKAVPIYEDGEGDFKPVSIQEPDDGGFKSVPIHEPMERDLSYQEPPFMAKHPNLYAAKETVKDLITDAPKMLPYVKYFYPEEREKFLTMDKQHQVRELLKENLFSQLFMVPGTKGFKYGLSKAGSWFAKNFPKTAKAFTSPRMVSKLKLEEAAIEVERQTPAVKKVLGALKEAKPLRKEQEAIYTQMRGERIQKLVEIGKTTSGEEGYRAQLGALKGQMPKVQFESIRKQIGQGEIDSLFNQIKTSSLNEWDKLPAGKGLAKIFGEYGGTVPTENELAMLKEVFGSEFVKTTMGKMDMFARFKKLGLEVANVPRSLMASYDLSAPLRQGLFLIGRPKQWFPAFKSMFKPFGSEKAYQQLNKEIASRPTYALMRENKLSLTELGGGLTSREEAFMSPLAEKIPVIGRGVRASGRAYTAFLNKLRADVFDDFVKKGAELGIKDPKYIKDAAKFINHATGRGSLGELESAAVPLNTWFFSPRLIASRLQLLNPQFYGSLEPTVRKEALKSLFTLGSVALGTGGLMKLGGATVELDPRNADFMKPKFGNTRYDILGGFQQPIRLAAQVISGKVISSTTGKTMVLGEGYRGLTRTEIISRFLEYKQSPMISFGVNLMRGQTSLGEKTDVPTEVMNRVVPMVIRDAYDLYKEEGLKGIPMATPAIFGVGVQSYGGVSSFGLDGKDYPKLNKELLRLKTSMGYPSVSAFGQPLNNKEFKRLKLETGRVVANDLKEFMSSELYRETPDQHKVKLLEQRIDETKQMVKEKMFPDKERKSEYMADLREAGYSGEEVNKMADEYIKKNPLEQ